MAGAWFVSVFWAGRPLTWEVPSITSPVPYPIQRSTADSNGRHRETVSARRHVPVDNLPAVPWRSSRGCSLHDDGTKLPVPLDPATGQDGVQNRHAAETRDTAQDMMEL